MKKLALACMVLFMTSCAYVRNRCSDLTDVIHLESSNYSVGCIVNAGPIVLGHYQPGMSDKIRITKIGLGGIYNRHYQGSATGVIVPLEYLCNITLDDLKVIDKGFDRYSYVYPQLGSIGFHLACIPGIGLRTDIYELMDFMIGFTTLDISHDDNE